METENGTTRTPCPGGKPPPRRPNQTGHHPPPRKRGGKNRDIPLALLRAQALEAANDRPAATEILHRIIQWRPDSAEAYLALGRLHVHMAKWEKALDASRTAIRLAPDSADAHAALARALVGIGRKTEALAALRKAAALAPANAAILTDLGIAQLDAGDPLSAEHILQSAMALNPADVQLCRVLAKVKWLLGKKDAALLALRKAVELQPTSESARHDLARTLEQLDQREEAVEHYAAEAQLAPARAEPHYRIGECLRALGRWEDALTAFDAAIARDAGHILAHGGRALALLGLGRFKEGWAEYEWRWKAPSFPSKKITALGAKEWQGEPLENKRLLVHAEQGFGDTIMLVRYIPLLAQRGATITLQVPTELEPLLHGMPGAHRVISTGDTGPVDFTISTFSLPGLMQTDSIPAIPSNVPYITPDPARIAEWSKQLAPLPAPRIGICWAGNPKYWRDTSRSCPLTLCRPLFDLPNLHWISLTRQVPPEDRKLMAGLPQLLDVSTQLTDFAQTAALIANVDRVITVDTAIAHLAGALAKPTWLMLPHVAEWRWQQSCEDSPWYPTMRLFRQPSKNNWPALITRLCNELPNFLRPPN